MLNEHKNIAAALSEILPTYYELFTDSNTPMPCITYMEETNAVDIQSDRIGYSVVGYYIKVWAQDAGTIQDTAQSIDDTMRALGYTRTNSNELVVGRQIEKILTYEAYGFEDFREV